MIKSTKLGLAGGILWGACMFVTTILAICCGYGKNWLMMMGDVYPGYTISAGGSIVGLIYGFIDGYVGLFLLGWLYNKLAKK